MMDAATFERLTGRAPIQDDLERVNCRKICCVGHHSCGWNLTFNRPSFERHDSGDVIICGEDYVDANTVPEVLEFEDVVDAYAAAHLTVNALRGFIKGGTKIHITSTGSRFILITDDDKFVWKEVPHGK